MDYESIVEDVVSKINKEKYKIVSADKLSDIIKTILGDEFSARDLMEIRGLIIDHDNIDYFVEDTYINQNRFYYSVGNWFAIKDVYDNPVEAKFKMGMYAYES